MVTGMAALLDMLHDDDDETGFALRRAEWDGCDVRLTGHVTDGGERSSVWEITCTDVLGYSAEAPAWGDVRILEDPAHPLLRQYTERVVPLFFHGRATNVPALIGELWLAHRETCGD